jgi:preprotein translocase subunit SecG
MFNFIFFTLMAIFGFVCLFMILLVLIQKGRGGGLASAFGGGGGNTAFGSKTGDVLTWATSIVFGIFLVLAVTLNLMANSASRPPAVAGAAGVQDEGALPRPGPATRPDADIESPATRPATGPAELERPSTNPVGAVPAAGPATRHQSIIPSPHLPLTHHDREHGGVWRRVG